MKIGIDFGSTETEALLIEHKGSSKYLMHSLNAFFHKFK